MVVDCTGTPILAVPPYDDGSKTALVEALAGVDLGRCMHAPDPEVKELKRREEELRAAAEDQDKAQKHLLSAEENRRDAHANAAGDVAA